MTPAQLASAMRAMKWTQEDAGKALGVTSRSIRRWLSGERPIPFAVKRLIEILLTKDDRQRPV